MLIPRDALDRLVIPDGTTVEERDLVTDNDVIIGGRSTIEFGVRGNNLYAGERTEFGGSIESRDDCRLDMWCEVQENVLVGADASIGERSTIDGQLIVAGNLDIGDDVTIVEGFEASGWIVIRNPMPTLVFLFVYLSNLLRFGEEEAAEEIATELLGDDEETDALVIPRGSLVGDDAWRVSTPGVIGDECRLHGNIRASSLTVGEDTVIFGSVRTKRAVYIGEGSRVHGDVTTRSGTVTVAADAKVLGDLSCQDLELHDGAVVEGTVRASGEMTIITDDLWKTEEDEYEEIESEREDDRENGARTDSASESEAPESDDDEDASTESTEESPSENEGEKPTASETGSEPETDNNAESEDDSGPEQTVNPQQ